MLRALTNRTDEANRLWAVAVRRHPDIPKLTGLFFLEYFRRLGRKLPWRNTKDPYFILIAEMMLQKTHSRVVPSVWNAFVTRWPTPEGLARARLASIESVLRPLGLKKRAAWLRSLAKAVVKIGGGEVPRAYASLVALPGVGKYTANSVLCQAFGLNVAMVDVNAARVYCRVYGVRMKTDRQALLFGEMAANAAIQHASAREVNLGVFDLAQAICRTNPECPKCPLSASCEYGISVLRQLSPGLPKKSQREFAGRLSPEGRHHMTIQAFPR